MADYSWIDPLFKNARGMFGLDPKAAAEGGLIQRQGDYYDARTADVKEHTAKVIPATVAELAARAGSHGATTKKTEAETVGIGLKNKGAQLLADFLADDRNYVTTQDGRRVPDTNKLQAAYAAASLSAGDKTIQHLPGFMGGMNLQGNALSPAANLAAGGTNATAGAGMLKPIDLAPDHTLISKDPVTGAPVISRPIPNVPMRSNVGSIAPGDLRTAQTGTAQIPAGSSLSALMSGVGSPAMNAGPVLGPVEPISNVDATFQAPTNKTQLQLGAAKNTSNETIAAARNQTTLTKADKDNEARAEIARQRGATAEEVARIRAGGKPGAEAGVSPLDLNRRAKLEEDAVKAIVSGFSAGDSVNPEQASLLASAALTMFPNDPPNVAVQKFMQSQGIKPGSQVFGGTEFLVDGKPYDFNALRARLFGAGGAQAPAAPAPQTQPGAGQTTGRVSAGDQQFPESTVRAFLPPISGVQGNSLAGVVSGSQGAAKPNDRIEMDGIPFVRGNKLGSERVHGSKYTGINAETGQIETRYWDAEKKGWSDTPIGGSQQSFDRTKEIEDTLNGKTSITSPSGPGDEERAAAAEEAIRRALEEGTMTKGEADALRVTMESEAASTNPFVNDAGEGPLVQTARRAVGGLKQSQSKEAQRDPRVDSYAKGDWLGDVAIPQDAMELADRMGINREAYGIPRDADFSNKNTFLGTNFHLAGNAYDKIAGSPLGMVLTPKAYGDKEAAIKSGLKEFFSDVKAGKVRTSPKPAEKKPEPKPAEKKPEPKPAEKKPEPKAKPRDLSEVLYGKKVESKEGMSGVADLTPDQRQQGRR
jgi:hypothetical protein